MGKKNKAPSPMPVLLGVAGILVALLLFCLLALPRLQEKPEETTTRETQAQPEPGENTWDPEAFYTDGVFLRYGDGLVGIDVSVHQGIVDWPAVKAAGVEFVILRCGLRGSTVGELYVDEMFYENLDGARDAGLLVGAYFFSQALTVAEAREEAEFACRILDGISLDLPVYYDFERVNGDSRVPSEAEVPMTDCALAFCRVVERGGYRAGVYFNQSYGYHYLELERLQDYSLWLAEYNERPGFAYHFDCLQYSASGTLPGISTDVDLNLMMPET